MWAVLKRLWLGRRPAWQQPPPQPGQAGTSASASDYLRQLREQELSVGAALRRGEPVQRAPGQTASASDRPALRSAPAGSTPAAAARSARPAPDGPAAPGVSRATGDTATAYGVAGATIGAAASQASDD